MPRLSAPTITLSELQRETLEAIVRKRTNPQQLVRRAKIIVLAAQGWGIRATARELRIGRDVVQRWRRRWLELGEVAEISARLSDAPRPGAPGKYMPEPICAIVAIRCERPEDSGHPVTHWTQQGLADEALKRGVVESISQRSVGRFLKRSAPAATSGERLAEHGPGRGV